MTVTQPLIGAGNLTRESLAGQVAIVTGAGRGIGYETARALAWMGARVIIAEIIKTTGAAASRQITAEMGDGSALFIHTDISAEKSINEMALQVMQKYGRVDIVFNNACVTPVGPVKDTNLEDWDNSYAVHVRGPVALAKAFLPGMLARNYGVFVCVSSSGAAPFMGPYEVFKTAQVELANTLAAEMEETGVIVFTIGPGIVRTPGAEATIPKIARLYGKTVEEFYAMSQAHLLSVEAAGAGYAAAVALAERFLGQEIGSKQALLAAVIDLPENNQPAAAAFLTTQQIKEALALCREVRATLAEQSSGWRQRPLFERQWVLRDFKKYAGMPVEEWLDTLAKLESRLEQNDISGLTSSPIPLDKLSGYYAHLEKVAAGYIKDAQERETNTRIVHSWQEAVDKLKQMLG